jgi:hypothetical protein
MRAETGFLNSGVPGRSSVASPNPCPAPPGSRLRFRHAVVCGSVLAATVLIVALFRPDHGRAPPPPPVTGFEPATINLGTVPWRSTHDFALRFANHDAVPLEVSEVKSSCGCTVIDPNAFRGKVIEPQGSLQIAGTIGAGLSPGAFRRTVTAKDATGREYPAIISLQVAATYTLTPASIDFGEHSESEGLLKAVVQFTSPSARLVGGVGTDSDWLSASAQSGNIEIVADFSKLIDGPSFGRVNISTDDSYMPTYTIPVRVKKEGDVRCQPAHLFLMGQQHRSIQVNRRDGRAAEIATWQSTDPEILLEIAEPGLIRVRNTGTSQKTAVVVTILDIDGLQGRFPVSARSETSKK